MRIFITLLFFSLSTVLFAQVGINTDNPFATLDINTDTPVLPSTGILIPRVDDFATTNPDINQQSLLVYLTTAVSRNITGTGLENYEPGFYYWDNASTNWISFTAGGSGWNIEGNDNIDDTQHFMGTTTA
ncbi:MAG: hypothetical protein ABJJ08_04350, partial [Nonlabens ulvanivorans]